MLMMYMKDTPYTTIEKKNDFLVFKKLFKSRAQYIYNVSSNSRYSRISLYRIYQFR